MSFASRLQELVDRFSKGNKAEFARFTGVQEASVRQYLAGTKPAFDNLVAIARATRVTLDWLALGADSQISAAAAPDEVLIRRVAVRVSAGKGQLSSDPEHEWMHFPKLILERIGVRPENALAVEAAGDSMSPNINDGDLTIVDTSATDVIEGRVYAFSIGDDAYVKRLRRGGRGKLFMVSDNRELYPEPEEIPPQEPFTIHGRVKWAGRQL